MMLSPVGRSEDNGKNVPFFLFNEVKGCSGMDINLLKNMLLENIEKLMLFH